MKLSDFDYTLPPELIAQHPTDDRTASRLLHLPKAPATPLDRKFSDLPHLLVPGDVLVVNNTRVIKARLRGHKDSGGKVEVLIERVLPPDRVLAQVRASKPPRPGSRLIFGADCTAIATARREDLFELQFSGRIDPHEILERHGSLPLPPYITHAPEATDQERYQTVYAAAPGAVAAPTAGLHFDENLLARLTSLGVHIAPVTLHVGSGTFQPVRHENLTQHVMHAEHYQVSVESARVVNAAKQAGQRIVAVGTTSLRVLESAGSSGELLAGAGETQLFITPGFAFSMTDCLITNFHLPKSTLLMLVSAFAGHARMLAAYEHAITERYRFFSYGDAMLLERS